MANLPIYNSVDKTKLSYNMVNMYSERVICLHQYIDPSTYKLIGSGSIGHMWPKEGKLGKIYKNLTQPNTHDHLTCTKSKIFPRITRRSTIDESRQFSSIPTLDGLSCGQVQCHRPTRTLGERIPRLASAESKIVLDLISARTRI